MDKSILAGFAVSGITIAALSVALIAKNARIKHLEKVTTQLVNFRDLATRVIEAQFDRPDGAGIMIPKDLEYELDAFTLFTQNKMV